MINQVAFTGKNTLINSFKEFSTEKAHEYLNGGAVMPKVKKEVSNVSYASPFQLAMLQKSLGILLQQKLMQLTMHYHMVLLNQHFLLMH